MAATHSPATPATRIEEVVERYCDAFDRRDVEAALQLFTDDAVLVWAPKRAFAGKDGVRQALEWDISLSPTARTQASGVGVLAKGNVAVMESVVHESAEGIAYECPVVTVFEFSEDLKIRRLRSYYDKLGIMHQVGNKYPGIKGWALKKLINYLVAQGETGLEQPRVANGA
jgi:ketosteroid isomerase-like protein